MRHLIGTVGLGWLASNAHAHPSDPTWRAHAAEHCSHALMLGPLLLLMVPMRRCSR